MKKLKEILVLFSILIAVTMLAGCQPKQSPDETARIYFNMIVKEDKSEVSQIGIKESEVDRLIKEQKAKTVYDLKEYFLKQGASTTDDQIQNMYSSFIAAYKKVSVVTSVVSKDRKSATVLIKTNYFDTKQIYKKAEDDALKKVESKNLNDEQKAKKEFINQYIDNIMNQLKTAKPTIETRQKLFDFELKNNTWVPKDQANFSQELFKLIQNQ